MIKKLYCFDFDGTLCHTPEPKTGKLRWKEKTGTDWGHRSWWGKSDSIDTNVFEIPKDEWVYDKYLKAVSTPNSYVILATGRLNKVENMRNRVEEILKSHNMAFDEIHLNTGGDTFDFKTRLFEDLIEKTKCKHFTMYDDREMHLTRFRVWAKKQNIKITIVDVVNKKEETFNK